MPDPSNSGKKGTAATLVVGPKKTSLLVLTREMYRSDPLAGTEPDTDSPFEKPAVTGHL